MKNKRISVGRILGIPINVDYSWFLIMIFLTWILADSFFPTEYKNWTQAEYWSIGFLTSILLFMSILFHELGHSVIAKKYKIKVKRITLFIFGGVAEIANEPPKSSAEFWIAIAGPIASFVLVAFFALMASLFNGNEYFSASFKYLAYINFILAVFNLVPGFPLDGGRVFRAIVWAVTKNFKKATRIAATVGRFFGFFFIVLGLFQILYGDLSNGLWIAFIGWFLESAANSQIRKQALDELLNGHTVIEAMTSNFVIVHSDSTIEEILENHFIGADRRSMLVKENNEIIGFLSTGQLKNVPSNERRFRTVKEIMVPVSEIQTLSSNMHLLDALKVLEESEQNELPVIEHKEYLGILSRESVVKFIYGLHVLGH